MSKPDDSWYSRNAIEPWEYIKANNLDFFEGSIIKYATRWRHKNGIEDLEKVKVYADELIRQERERQRLAHEGKWYRRLWRFVRGQKETRPAS
jgi:hypothetical protein